MSKRGASGDSSAGKLARLGRESYVSQAGIASLMRTVRDEGIPEFTSRATQYRARKAMTADLLKDIALSRHDGGEDVIVTLQDPLTMLAHMAERSEHFAHVLRETASKHPCTSNEPWHIVIYQDGVDPSDGLAKNHSRRCAVFYWSVREFGAAFLAREELWFTPLIVRKDMVNVIDGRHERLAKLLLRSFVEPIDATADGIELKLYGGGNMRVYLRLGTVLADEPALKEIYGCKGHGGTKPCMLCQNAVLHRAPGGADGLHLHSAYARSIATADITEFIPHTDDSIRTCVQRLRGYKATLTETEYEVRSQMLGFTYNPHSIILDERLQVKAASTLMYDWAHCYVCDGGLADAEFGMLMKQFSSTTSTYSELGEYVRMWSFPAQVEITSVNQLFSVSANKNNVRRGTFSSGASEFLSLAPILKRYFKHVVLPKGEMQPHVKSFLAVLDVVDILQACKKGTESKDGLANAIKKHLDLFVLAWGRSSMRPKYHYVLHLPNQLELHGLLLTTFVHERKHKVVKRYCSNRVNLKSWERGTMEECTVHFMHEMASPFLQVTDEFASPRKAQLHVLKNMFPNVRNEDFSLHRTICVQDGNSSHGDVVMFNLNGGREVGELLMNLGVWRGPQVTMYSYISAWEPRGVRDGRSLMTYSVKDYTVMIPSADVICSLMYARSAQGATCSVMIPYGLQ